MNALTVEEHFFGGKKFRLRVLAGDQQAALFGQGRLKRAWREDTMERVVYADEYRGKSCSFRAWVAYDDCLGI